ncbi:MAG: hypothetical protein V8Q42_06115 [Anaerovoracaceae bacterium]
MTNTSIPIPPSQCDIAFQSSSAWQSAAWFAVHPVVVKPDVDSKKAVVKLSVKSEK